MGERGLHSVAQNPTAGTIMTENESERFKEFLLRELEQADFTQYLYDNGNWDLFHMTFRVARIAQGLGKRERMEATAKNTMESIGGWLDGYGIPKDMFHERLFGCWEDVKQPSGAHNPIESAYEHCRKLMSKNGQAVMAFILPNNFAEWPSERYRMKVSIIFRMAIYLSEDGNQEFYLPSRKVGELLNLDRTTAAAMVKVFERKGHFKVYEMHTKKRSTRYMLTSRALELAHSQDQLARADRDAENR